MLVNGMQGLLDIREPRNSCVVCETSLRRWTNAFVALTRRAIARSTSSLNKKLFDGTPLVVLHTRAWRTTSFMS